MGKEENFFEENEQIPEVELAKSESGVLSRPKINIKKNEGDDFEDEPEGQLTVDVYQTPTEIIIESAVAGVEPDDLDINITTDSVSIKGHRRRKKEVKDEDYFYQECYWGKFARSVILPQEIDPEESWADFKNGILTVHLQKLNRKKAKKLKVSS